MGVNRVLLQACEQRRGHAKGGFPTRLKTRHNKRIIALSFKLASGVMIGKVISEALWVAVYVGHVLKSVGIVVLNNFKLGQSEDRLRFLLFYQKTSQRLAV